MRKAFAVLVAFGFVLTAFVGVVPVVHAAANTPYMTDILRKLGIEEFYVEDEFRALLGDPKVLPRRRYPQAIALALALRHSWRPDDLACILSRLG